MTYEEKRELRLQISQLLADAGLNQGKIKEIVENEIQNKVNRAVEQTLKSLDAQSSDDNYIKERLNYLLNHPNTNYMISQIIKEELKNRVIQIKLNNVELES